ncbi:tetratricopeptide (TPR) repeat protein [Granulicella aggregans]|uniref:Tetratricopeptide (TPR) repeat protein n=1 Tax=Granulicella aggregans TaxID=474949 RepID=A0A7W7ZHH4_9BACT|nr:tetratricopeptide repeat protein [Granulicella aggregans]MBB5060024.1 tetratricopeptide (TPR) repeat protein [Granulicella aggregans]
MQAQPGPSLAATTSITTPAQLLVSNAKRKVLADQKKADAYADLASAYVKRVRETDSPQDLLDAERANAEGLKLDAGNFQLQKTQVAILLADQRYIEAKERASLLNRQVPDDVMIYGYLAESDLALGNYDAAEKSAQWMLNMRPNNLPGLLIAARLRSVYGDADGALELLDLAYSETSPSQIEDQAWIANQIAAIQMESGSMDAAISLLEKTYELFPDYPFTLASLSRARLAQHRAADAIQLLLRAKQISGKSHYIYLLALAQEAAGQSSAASASYAEFTALATQAGNPFDSSQLDLISLYAKDPVQAPNALILARQQLALRHDVWTLDASAWALFANADFVEAAKQEQKAIAIGIQSAQIFDHAGQIAQKLNQNEQALTYFERSLKVNAASQFSENARKALRRAPGASLPPVAPTAVPSSSLLPTAEEPQVAAIMSPFHQPMPAVVVFAPVPAKLLTPLPTDTDRLIHKAQSLASNNPKQAKAYSSLGASYFQRARETGDASDYQLAEEALTKSLELVSTDFSADEPLSTLAEVCMGEHRFNDALTYSQKALSLGSGDVSSFAIVGDAYADMGSYDKAAQAYARLTPRDMTLTPRAAYARDSRLAYLKFVAGDTPAAIALMKAAVEEGNMAQLPSENLAWLYYELGEFDFQTGSYGPADIAYLTALNIHPGDYRALASLAKLRAASSRYDEAILLYQKAIDVVPMPIFVAELGDLYAKTSHPAEATKQYQLVQYIGLLGQINQVLHNRDLALFYADHDIKLPESLALAQKELEVRQDVYTWDALAWALYKNGNIPEAAKMSEKALQYGTKDSILLFHSGMILMRDNQLDRAKISFTEALQINPHFHLLYASQAQQQLNQMGVKTGIGANFGR